MSDFTVSYPTGSTLYAQAESILDGTDYNIALTDNLDGTYTGDMDSSAPRGQYVCRIWKQAGGSPDYDADTLLYPGETRIWDGADFDFDGAISAAVSAIAGRGNVFMKRLIDSRKAG